MDRFLEALEQFWNGFLSGIADLPAIITGFYSQFDEGRAVFTLVTRWLLPILAIIIFIRCILPLIQYRDQNKTWGYLCSKDGTRMPLRHWENSIGRSKLSDIVINLSFVSRCHAVLTFCEGVWSIADLGSKGGVEVNGKKSRGRRYHFFCGSGNEAASGRR